MSEKKPGEISEEVAKILEDESVKLENIVRENGQVPDSMTGEGNGDEFSEIRGKIGDKKVRLVRMDTGYYETGQTETSFSGTIGETELSEQDAKKLFERFNR